MEAEARTGTLETANETPLLGFYLYFAVFVSGAAVLFLEIIGTRILGPTYGVTIYLWSTLIAITLLALSLGYALGGRLADKRASANLLFLHMAAAGVWTVFIPFLKGAAIQLALPLGLRGAMLAAGLILFAAPLTLLAGVTPIALRVRAHRLGQVGTTAGNISAVSTVGSVLSALATGYWLIPNVGVFRLTLGTGLLLIAAATLGFLLYSNRRLGTVAATGLVVCAIAAGWAPSETQGQEGILVTRQSVYAQISVQDRGDNRMLLLDNFPQTGKNMTTGRTAYRSHCLLGFLRHLHAPDNGRILIIGMGGGVVVEYYLDAGWDVDVVEIDPVVADFAREYFGLRIDPAEILVEDGIQTLNRVEDGTYDIILADVYGAGTIPFHLVTREAYALIKRKLKPGGLLGISVIALGWEGRWPDSLAQTLRTSFENVVFLPTAGPYSYGELVPVASDSEIRLETPIRRVPGREFEYLCQSFAWRNRFEPVAGTGQVITDDLNPTEVWIEKVSREARYQEGIVPR